MSTTTTVQRVTAQSHHHHHDHRHHQQEQQARLASSSHELQPMSATTATAPPATSQAEEPIPSQRQQPDQPPSPVLKLVSAGYSFFCAGVNDGTFGALVPYMLTTFNIGTGEIALIYINTFVGWLLAAGTNPILAAHLNLGQLLFLGAALQLLAQCLRPWSPLPVFCISYFLQALGMAYQDAHGNTFVSTVNVAHRWLGFIHACYALGLLVGPLIATTLATHGAAVTADTPAIADRGDAWRKTYFVLIGLSFLNVLGVVVGFRRSLLCWGKRRGNEAAARQEGASSADVPPAAAAGAGAAGAASPTTAARAEESKKTKVAWADVLEILKLKEVWLISLFFFFELGAGFSNGGWIVEFLTTIRHGDLSKVGYIPTGFYAGLFLGRILLAEPTFRFGEKRMILIYNAIIVGLQLVVWLAPNIIANATALALNGFFSGPFFATGVSVASRIFPRKVQSTALSFVFVIAQAGGALFPSITGLIASHAGVQVLQPIVIALEVAAAICWFLLPKITSRSD